MTEKLKQVHIAKTIFWYLVLAIFALVIAYFYLVNQTVYNVANRGKIEREIASLHGEIGELEFKAISLKNEISPEYASSLGFREVATEHFIQRSKDPGTLSVRQAN